MNKTEQVTEAVGRMNHLAVSLGRVLGPDLAAHVLIGAGINALVSHYGKAGAVEFLHKLAAEVEADESAPTVN